MLEYPKIETLYNRNEKTHSVIPGQLRLAEFDNIHRWQITEKIDGTNIRVGLSANGQVICNGRTDNAQLPGPLLSYLQATFTAEKLAAVFNTDDQGEVLLFGEGYGPKIQKGGIYRRDMAFRLFDVRVGPWWLEPDAIADVAAKLNIMTVPFLGEIDVLPQTGDDLKTLLGNNGNSTVALQDQGSGGRAEGIVARTAPLLLTRRGERLMWKLKFRDF